MPPGTSSVLRPAGCGARTLREHARVMAVLLLAAVAGCSPLARAANDRGGDRVVVVSSVAPLNDIVRQVSGDEAELVQLIPEGVDSHTFEASPATARALARADIAFFDGLHLEESILGQARASMPAPVSLA